MTEPMVDMIGDWACEHGERGDLDPDNPDACLCGVEPYWMCDGPGIAGMTFYATDRNILVLDDDAPTVVIQNDLLRYLFSDDDEEDE